MFMFLCKRVISTQVTFKITLGCFFLGINEEKVYINKFIQS